MSGFRTPSVSWSLIVLAFVFVLDRAHKFIQVDVIGWQGGEIVPLAPFLDYVMVWNPGISYGLLGGLPPAALLAVMAGAMIALAVWWWTDTAFWTRIGIALAIGGALSNAIDRLVYGAVADFFHFYVGTFSWYVFNIADVAITFGVVILVLDVLWPKTRGKDSETEDEV